MSDSLVIEVLLGILAVAIGVGSFLGATRAGRYQKESHIADIDAQAYDRAKIIYESAIDALEEHVKRLHDQMEQLGTEVQHLREANHSLSIQVVEMKVTNARLEAELDIQKRIRLKNERNVNEGNQGTSLRRRAS